MAIELTELTSVEKQTLVPVISVGILNAIRSAADALISQETPEWQVHVAGKRDQNGCVDLQLHFHTCRLQQKGEEAAPEPQPDQEAGYL